MNCCYGYCLDEYRPNGGERMHPYGVKRPDAPLKRLNAYLLHGGYHLPHCALPVLKSPGYLALRYGVQSVLH